MPLSAVEKLKALEEISDADDKVHKMAVSAKAHKSVVSIMKPPNPDEMMSQQAYLRSPVEVGNKMYLAVAAISILCVGLLVLFCTFRSRIPAPGKSV